MKIYFSYGKLPELSGLTRGQRQAVLRCAMEAYYGEDPSRVWFGAPWIFGGLLAGGLAGWLLVQGGSMGALKWVWVAGSALFVAGLAVFVAGQFVTAELRPYLRRVLEERKDEIAGIR